MRTIEQEWQEFKDATNIHPSEEKTARKAFSAGCSKMFLVFAGCKTPQDVELVRDYVREECLRYLS